MFKSSKWVLTGALSIVLASTSALASKDWPSSFTVGSASQGGTYFTYGSGWANLVAQKTGVNGGAEVTGGPVQNIAMVHTGELAFGMTTMGPASEALQGKNPLMPGMKMDKIRAIFPMYETPFSVTTLASSNITSISEIPAGARIGFGPAGSTSDTYFPEMLTTLGVDYVKRNGGWNDLVGQLQDGLIDVIAFAAGVPIPAVTQLEVQHKINIISFNKSELKTLTEEFPVAQFDIPAGTYGTLDEPSSVVSMWNFSIANADLDEDFVYNVVQTIMGDHEAILRIHNAARTTIPENYVNNQVIQWHPGAVRWFEENGYTIADNLK